MKRVFITLIIVLVIAGAVGVILWNKPHRKAESEAGVAISSEALYNAYKSDERAANSQYLNKMLAVTGELTGQEKNQDGQAVAILRGEPGDDLLSGGIMCTMREKDAAIPAGRHITLKGICTGFANDVHLTDCIVQSK